MVERNSSGSSRNMPEANLLLAEWPVLSHPHELRRNGALIERVIPRDHCESRRRHKIISPVFVLVVANDRALRNMDVTVDDRALDAAMAADVNVRKDDARVDLGEGVHAYVLGEHAVA